MQVQQIDGEKQRFIASLRCSDLRLTLISKFDEMKDRIFQRFLCRIQEEDMALQSLWSGGVTAWLTITDFL